jgi:hypothetical protein
MGISKNKPLVILRSVSQGPLLIKCIFRNPGLSIVKMLIITAGQSYGLIPALSLELLFRLAGIHVFLILAFQDQKNI